MTFHDFITKFQVYLADLTYADVDKAIWEKILERQLSHKLRDILLSASDEPTDYYNFVAYLREQDICI